MPTLAPKLPYTHPFAGGYPRVGGQPLPTDPDAIDYLERVAAADGAGVEVGVAMAIDQFIKGCKADSAGYAGDPTRTVWDALQASCIMCGARTVAGALVPLKRPYGPEKFNPSASPSINGATGSYNVSTRTMTNHASAEFPSYPRFNFNYSLTQNKRYRIDGVLSGDIDAVYGLYLGGTALSDSRANGVLTFSGIYTATDATTLLGLWFRGQQYFPASVTIESLSIREDSFTPTAYPQPVNFVSADYSRTTGLKGDGSTKYIDSNRANNADGQDDVHVAAYLTASASNASYVIGANAGGSNNTVAGYDFWCRSLTGQGPSNAPGAGLNAVSRSSSASFTYVDAGGAPQTSAKASATQSLTNNVFVFAYNVAGYPTNITNARLAFYSIGSAIPDLAALDSRVTQLVTGIKFHSLTGLVATDYDPDTVAYIVAAYESGGTL